jgi:Rrf2 family protein
MKLSTKGRYGLRAMVDLAVYSNGEHVSLFNIAQRQNISENYLEQVFSILRKAGLVKSVKGAQGGYVLGDKPSRILIGSILRALEGNLSIIDEEVNLNGIEGDAILACISINIWEKLNNKINEFVDSIPLEELVNEYKRISGSETNMYYI